MTSGWRSNRGALLTNPRSCTTSWTRSSDPMTPLIAARQFSALMRAHS